MHTNMHRLLKVAQSADPSEDEQVSMRLPVEVQIVVVDESRLAYALWPRRSFTAL